MEPDINILLLGQTGVGKTTFINAFANYLAHQSLASAIEGEMVVLIPASFIVINPDTFELARVSVGIPNSNERYDDHGQSNTQGCQSFKFTFGNRNVRLIDAPGIGDTRGVEQDARNFEHILAYINQYKYLNGICILFKPNEERLTMLFRFCIKELLTHLHMSARENIIFVFTNARSTFYTPGASAPILRTLLNGLRDEMRVDVPFTSANTFCLDNEPFRFLAAHKHGVRWLSRQRQNHVDSWKHSAKELIRLFSHIVNCKPHDIQDTLSINEAQQVIRRLTRPMNEVFRLINENIDLAKLYEQRAQTGLSDDYETMHAIPQKSATVKPLQYPCTVCTSDNCTSIQMIDGEVKVRYNTECHKNCRLRKIEQEVINNPALLYCHAIDRDTKRCKQCGCDYTKHMHITYRYEEFNTYVDMNNDQAVQRQPKTSLARSSMSYGTWLSTIKKRISDLENEQQCMVEIASKLSHYLHQNSISPYNDDFLEYLELMIREEKMKQRHDKQKKTVVNGLQRLSERYRYEVKFLKENVPTSRTNEITMAKTIESTNRKVKEVFNMVKKLYTLPICGSLIREQVEGLKRVESNAIREHEITVSIPLHGPVPSLVEQLDDAFSPAVITTM